MKTTVTDSPATRIYASGKERFPAPEADPTYPSDVAASLMDNGLIEVGYRAHVQTVSIPELNKEVDAVVIHAIALSREDARRFALGILELLAISK